MQNVFVGGFHILLGHCTILLMVSSRIFQIWSAPAGHGELSAEKKLIRNGEMNNNNHCLQSPVLIGQCSGHLRHDYRIKYAYFVKCYLERFASISDPEKWTTNVAQRKKKKKPERWFQITRDIASSMTSQNPFPKLRRVANINLRNFCYQNVT